MIKQCTMSTMHKAKQFVVMQRNLQFYNVASSVQTSVLLVLRILGPGLGEILQGHKLRDFSMYCTMDVLVILRL